MRSALPAVLVLAALPLLAGCPPQIGDSCGISTDCSVNGDRLCDQAQPNGYCTVTGCEADTCPEDTVCVQFRPDPTRLAQSACMKSCGETNDCREEDGYVCTTAANLGCFQVEETLAALPVAVVIDEEHGDRAFCAAANPALYTPVPCP